MNESEQLRFIREEIKRQLNVILCASAGANTEQKETIDELYPGMPSITDRPVMHPYGLSSRAPAKTISVTARVGDHVGNRMVIGHRDKDRPALENGETAIYNAHGVRVTLLKGGKIAIENDTVELIDRLVDLVTALTNAKTLTMMGPQPFWSATQTELSAIKEDLETLKR